MGHHPEQIPPAALPVDGRGMIGNMKTAALVSLSGTMDFMCFPRVATLYPCCSRIRERRIGA
ncbi:hypothetical protein AWB75_01115 [Caballeronia catudaia]|uniref:Uncharacterized protein n=1 Tax=Caballeronia catudaia TaxID=1777136 RepID=A0A157ZRX9_9BURK|nr:hypothetical protein [Caballeronia catudaia]SAK48260.1 hypothetical protein AWB75_01115 [Caballeronia catudaia]